MQIGLGYGVVIALALIMGGIAIRSLLGVGAESARLSRELVPQVTVSNDMERSLLTALFDIRGYVLALDKKYLDPGTASLDQVDGWIDDALSLS
jgi:methyl-accepting chemotaxis protein